MPDFCDPVWVQALLTAEGRVVTKAVLEPVTECGFSCDVQRLVVSFDAGGCETFILKQTKAGSNERSTKLGLAREAIFYQRHFELGAKVASHDALAIDIGAILPDVLFADGDIQQG